jgi:hypothetical protein
LIISAENFSAISKESAVLPTAVGPTIAITFKIYDRTKVGIPKSTLSDLSTFLLCS